MSISATEAVGGIFGATGASAVDRAKSGADKEMFLQLLVAQMRYQDPMNPTDSSQFLAQSAQFTALEKMQDVADQTAALVSTQMAFGASGLIGKQISWTDAEGMTQTGSVSGVTFGADGPMLDVAGSSVPLASVLTVTGATNPTDSSTTTDPTDPAA